MKMKLTIEVESLDELSQIVDRLKGTNVTLVSEDAEPVDDEVTDVSYDDITRVLSVKAKAGKTNEIKELLSKYGVKSAKKLDPSQYSTFLDEAKTI